MASSAKRKRGKTSRSGIASHVAACLAGIVQPGHRLVLGLSGGVDSIVLLDVLARLARRRSFRLETLHVNHQLSPNAAAWARFSRSASRGLGVPCRVVKVDVLRTNSVERAAREARYAALLGTRADHVVLAHNRDDQAETVLLRLLRGTGARGLGAMPVVRAMSGSLILRPMLDVPRDEIERYAKRKKLQWIEDESNADLRYTRNWLRREILPRIAERVPSYREIFARAARNLGEAGILLDEFARLDATTAAAGEGLHLPALRAMSAPRAKNLLRFVIEAHGWRMPDAVRLTEGLRQALHARPGAKVAVNLGSCELRRHGQVIYLLPPGMAPTKSASVTWRGEAELHLPGGAGVLAMKRTRGAGLSAARLGIGLVTVRGRQGGERLQVDGRRPRRTVKNLLQEARMAPWERERLPFIYCGEELVCVPGIGFEHRFRAREGEASILPAWRGEVAAAKLPSRRR